jgi:ribosome maturation protein Sdo1
MAESSAGDFTVGKIQKTRRQRVAKMYDQQKRNIIHMSSTAYEQDHSAAAPSMPTRTSEDVAEVSFGTIWTDIT